MTTLLLHRARLSKERQAASVHREPGEGDQTGYTLREWWRSRVFFIFTFLVPLTVLVVLGFVFGTRQSKNAEDAIHAGRHPQRHCRGGALRRVPAGGQPVARPRDRLSSAVRGTPLRLGCTWPAVSPARWPSPGLTADLVVVAVSFYGVRIMWSTALATTVTVVCRRLLRRLGLAVATLTRSARRGRCRVVRRRDGAVLRVGVYSTAAGRVGRKRRRRLSPQAVRRRAARQFDPSPPAPDGMSGRWRSWQPGRSARPSSPRGRSARDDPPDRFPRTPVPRTAGRRCVAVTAELRATAPGRPSTAAMLLTRSATSRWQPGGTWDGSSSRWLYPWANSPTSRTPWLPLQRLTVNGLPTCSLRPQG